MTDQHPLTDKEALSLFPFERLMDTSQPITIEDAMRTAADWQLEQVIKWMKDHNTEYIRKDSLGIYFDEDKCIDDFKKAMRPTTTTQENN